MKIIEPRVSESSAIAYFERPHWRNLWGLLRRPPIGGGSNGLPSVQLFWLPHYFFPVHVTSPKGPGKIDVCVEAHSGAFALFEMHPDLVLADRVEGERFDPKLEEEEVLAIGRRELLKTILRRRGNRDKPTIVGTGEVDLFYYPFWVYFYERRRGLIDILVYDAARGIKAGARTKVGILSGMVGSDTSARKALEPLARRPGRMG